MDLVYLFGVRAPWYGSWQGELWQQSICWVFILLSGFCLPLGRHPVKRGTMVFGCGALVTAVTLIFMPADAVWFGVLTLLGSAMIITGLLEKWMEKVPPVVGLAGSMFLFYFTRHAADGYLQLGHWLVTLPGFLYANYFTAYLAFTPLVSSLPITSRCSHGCFCSGPVSICTIWSGRNGWNRFIVLSARRWGGWGGTR